MITNVDFNALKDYLPYAVEFSTENLLTESLPGSVPDLKQTNNVSIFVVDEEETQQMIKELFYPEEQTENGNTVDANTTNSSSSDSSATLSKSNIKIEVLNGTNNGKVLQELVNKLTEEGYNVSRTGNTTSTSKTTIANKNNITDTIMKDIEQIVGVDNISNNRTGASSKADITIIIGKDYE